jgi:hypothetical protein
LPTTGQETVSSAIPLSDVRVHLDQRDRIPGLLYLVVVLTGMFSIAYAPGQLFASSDPAVVLSTLREDLPLLRATIVTGAICYIAFLLLPMSLYRSLSPRGRNAAVLMVAFVAVSVPISLANLGHRLELLALAEGHGAFGTWTEAQMHSSVSLAVHRYGAGQRTAVIFWGLWLIPFGMLILRSRLLPRALGVLLILGGVGYPVAILGSILSPAFSASPWSSWITLPATVGELGTCAWLLLRPLPKPAS